MSNKLEEADVWIGKTLFHPLVIFLCQLLKCTQYRLSRDIWFFVSVGIICEKVFYRHISPNFLDWLMVVFFFAIASFRDPEKKSGNSIAGRLFLWALWFLSIFIYSINGEIDSLIRDVVLLSVLLLAEYALTIDTIPPKKDKKKKEAYHEQLSG